ncbi:MAG: class I tRNA ligase family protein, partial [Candidatus Aminicenantes bacterium]|nr:class I tRNA ligase family protein [Candidatus Aminicenantes bacterium]
APYKTVLTHGFVVDGEGKKMSKTLGNVIHPNDVIKKYGAEVLRLWVAAEDYRDDIRISGEILQRLSEAYRRYRNTCRFLLGNLTGFDPASDRVADADLEEIDRWALHRLQQLIADVLKAYESFEFHRIHYRIHNFCVVDMSAFYLDVLKDRLYCSGFKSRERRSAQTAMFEILRAITALYAPLLPFTTEEIWGHLAAIIGGLEASVHVSRFPSPDFRYMDQAAAGRWEELIAVRETVNRNLEEARRQKQIGSSLEAEVVITAPGKQFALLKESETFLPTLFIVSSVRIEEVEDGKETVVVIRNAPGTKCERCWNYQTTVGDDPEHPTLCRRCAAVLRA